MLWKYRIAKWTDSQPYWCRFIFFQRLTSYELDKLHWKFLQIKFWDILKFLFIEQQMKINLNVKILISKNNLCQLNRLFPWVTGRWFYLRVKILQIILKLFLFTTLIWIIKLLKCNKQSWFQKNSNDLFLEGYHFCRATSFLALTGTVCAPELQRWHLPITITLSKLTLKSFHEEKISFYAFISCSIILV